MLSLQEISDRIEIEDLIHRYSVAIDGQNWALLDEVFTPDAHIDYREIAGFESHDREALKEWLTAGLTPLKDRYFHMCISNEVHIDGDAATAVVQCFNPMTMNDVKLVFGHWYRDSFVRTPDGWRICERWLQPCFKSVLPAD